MLFASTKKRGDIPNFCRTGIMFNKAILSPYIVVEGNIYKTLIVIVNLTLKKEVTYNALCTVYQKLHHILCLKINANHHLYLVFGYLSAEVSINLMPYCHRHHYILSK